MDSETKITISQHELVCLLDTDFLLTKRLINDKVQALLLQLATALSKEPLSASIATKPPKISKGENYRGLPYWVLDYPADFGQESILAYRTICRWGYEFSFTLQLSGEYLKKHQAALLANYSLLKSQDGLYLCINSTMWEHHFGEDNYRLFDEVIGNEAGLAAFLAEWDFVKLAFKMPLEEWDGVVERGVEFWRIYENILEY